MFKTYSDNKKDSMSILYTLFLAVFIMVNTQKAIAFDDKIQRKRAKSQRSCY